MTGNRRRLSRLTPARAKRLLSLAKVIGPVVIPVVAPIALRAAGTVRDQYDRMRARRLGVDVDDLARFSGRGGALHARIAGAARGMAELHESDPSAAGYTADSQHRLESLAAAVRAAERMPTTRRRAAHRAIGAELDSLEAALLLRLGI